MANVYGGMFKMTLVGSKEVNINLLEAEADWKVKRD
jgi:hypothetical protein